MRRLAIKEKQHHLSFECGRAAIAGGIYHAPVLEIVRLRNNFEVNGCPGLLFCLVDHYCESNRDSLEHTVLTIWHSQEVTTKARATFCKEPFGAHLGSAIIVKMAINYRSCFWPSARYTVITPPELAIPASRACSGSKYQRLSSIQSTSCQAPSFSSHPPQHSNHHNFRRHKMPPVQLHLYVYSLSTISAHATDSHKSASTMSHL